MPGISLGSERSELNFARKHEDFARIRDKISLGPERNFARMLPSEIISLGSERSKFARNPSEISLGMNERVEAIF